MTSIKEASKGYESKTTRNVAELQSVSVDLAIFEGTGKDKDQKEFKYNYIEVDCNEYRVPDQVLKDLKAIMEKKPSLKTFSVSKQGQGFNTKYTVIPLD